MINRPTLLSVILSAALLSCAAPDIADSFQNTTLSQPNTSPPNSPTEKVLNPALFDTAALVKNTQEVSCTLTNGQSTTCTQFVVKHAPKELASSTTNVFCPQTIKDTGGLWDWDGKKAGLYKVDGAFLTLLNGLGYTFYDAEGHVHISNTDSRPGATNTCIEAEYKKDVEITVLLPNVPQMANSPTPLGTVAKVGLALDGAPVFSDAPSVEHTGHMPALSRCGGHVDPGGWFHWHATATDIHTTLEHEGLTADCQLSQGANKLFGYAFDGFPMYGSADQNGQTPTDLDNCSGHIAATAEYPKGIYHYHASKEFPNLPSCLKGVVAKDNFKTTAQTGIGSSNGGPGSQPPPPGGGQGVPPSQGMAPGGTPSQTQPDFSEAAKTLGVSLEALNAAMRPSTPGERPDLAKVAQQLGVTEAALRAALPPPPDQATPSGTPPPPSPPAGMPPPPDFTEAAAKLGIPVETLNEAMRPSSPGERPNLALAAQKLGISEEKLKAALPPPPS